MIEISLPLLKVESQKSQELKSTKLPSFVLKSAPSRSTTRLSSFRLDPIKIYVKNTTTKQQPTTNSASQTSTEEPARHPMSEFDPKDLNAYLVVDDDVESEGELELGEGYVSIDPVSKIPKATSSEGKDSAPTGIIGATPSRRLQPTLPIRTKALDLKNKSSQMSVQAKNSTHRVDI